MRVYRVWKTIAWRISRLRALIALRSEVWRLIGTLLPNTVNGAGLPKAENPITGIELG